MVLADAEDVEAHLVGVRDLIQQVAKPLRGAAHDVRVTDGRREAVDADLHSDGNSRTRRSIPDARSLGRG